jgi:hypothetical protein
MKKQFTKEEQLIWEQIKKYFKEWDIKSLNELLNRLLRKNEQLNAAPFSLIILH